MSHALQLVTPALAVAVIVLLGLLLGRRERASARPEMCLTFTLAATASLVAAVAASMYFLHIVLQMHKAYWLVPIFGAVGGLVGSLVRNDNSLSLVSFDAKRSRIRLGFVGDMVLGLGGASAVIFLFDNTLKFDPSDTSSYPLLVSISFLSGVFGRLVVEEAGKKMIREALGRATKAEEGVERLLQPSAMISVLESREQYKAGRYEEALDSAGKALSLDPENIKAMNAKARALKQLNRMPEAFEIINQALNLPRGRDQTSLENYAVLLYNKVCYGLALGKLSEDDAISALQVCFDLYPTKLHTQALTDHDLDSLRQNEKFQHLFR